MSDQFHLYLHGPDCGPLAVSFESAAQRLSAVAGLYFEPDGSFVCNRDRGRQQIFGMLYDAAGRLQYVECRGTADKSLLREITRAIDPNESEWTVIALPKSEVQNLQSFESLVWPQESS